MDGTRDGSQRIREAVLAVTREVEEAMRELRRRARARESLHTYALSVDIPTAPFEAPCPDEELLGDAKDLMERHHAAMLSAMQRCVLKPGGYGRLMMFLPPGSAKSLYTSTVLPTWYMGKFPGARIIITSYGDKLAERHSRRSHLIVEQQKYKDLWIDAPKLDRDAAGDWSLTNRSEALAMSLTGGMTGNRANGLIVDDPVKGREQADSELERQTTLNAYEDDAKSRLLPGAWIILIMTRWHEQDLAGSILPDNYDGRSGIIRCKDGMDWEVLNIPAKCERDDDPLGRKPGEYLWTSFYGENHWKMYEDASGPEAARRWASLYQQRPSPQGAGRFNESMFDFYDPDELPPLAQLKFVGAGDYAVTTGKNDFTELGVFGVDTRGDLWEVDWWNKQCDTGESVEKTLDFIKKWRIPMWFNEGGVIDKAMRPLFNRRQRERRVYCDFRSLPSMQDKVAKCSSFQGRAATGTVHFRNNANSRRVVGQLVALPAGRYDDAADVCGLAGRAIDQFPIPHVQVPEERKVIKPFSTEWLEYEENEEKKVRYR